MAVYLDEDMMGSDEELIGFPHVLVCMGLVCLAKDRLYGIHLTTPKYAKEAIPLFKNWLGTEGIGGGDIKLMYGSANFKRHYNDPSDPVGAWQAEMREIAGTLGFRGKVQGFDTSIITPKNGTYIEYHPEILKTSCHIYYKKEENVEYQETVSKAPVEGMAKAGKGKLLPVTGRVRTGASVKNKWWKKTELDEVDYVNRVFSVNV